MPLLPENPGAAGRRSTRPRLVAVDGFYRMAALGACVGLIGLVEAIQRIRLGGTAALPLLAIAIGLGIATGLSRHRPGLAVAVTWLVGCIQALSNIDGMVTEAAIVLVLFGASRYGSVSTVWVSGLSIPAAYLAGALYVRAHGTGLSVVLGASALARATPRPTIVLAVTMCLALTLPWLLGLTLRTRAQARTNLREMLRAEAMRDVADTRRGEAEELARVKDEQVRLARDLHDVVGHSLTVILAQAQSADYVPDDDAARLKEIMGTIASSARRSLGDIHRVLSETPDPDTTALDTLLSPLIEAGRNVEHAVIGRPRPLPPDLAVVAYRVMQEMLTNALGHGTATEPIGVTMDWGPILRIAVSNTVEEPSSDRAGLGLGSMRARLASVQGTLSIEEHDGTFVATAAIPTSANTDDPWGELA